MHYRRIMILVGSVVLVAAAAQTVAGIEPTSSEDDIRAVVEAAYIHGAFNEQNTDDMRAGFHPTFKIHGVANGELSVYPIDDWIDGIEEGKRGPDYQPQTWTHRFPIIDVTGDAAIVKVELFHDGGHVFTDYLSLLRFADGWKITDKVFHRHGDS